MRSTVSIVGSECSKHSPYMVVNLLLSAIYGGETKLFVRCNNYVDMTIYERKIIHGSE